MKKELKRELFQYKLKIQKEKISRGIELFLWHIPESTCSGTDNVTNALGHFYLLFILHYASLSIPLSVPYILSYFLSFVLSYNLGF